jgi:energy-coupling factor transporter ATP-binding protein EcfA2
MNNYDLLTLSWVEFEDLTRDLLQSELGIFIESFTPGKDCGIDLRLALTNNKKAIVQCKRMNNYNTLYSQLKKEKVKLKDMNIDRYYISTTVGLTPNGKNKIFQLFSPLIKSEADIFGKDDINNLIAKHQNIEKKYYKLWLTSSTVLQELLNAKVYNLSKMQIKQIKENTKIYVQNDSFNEAQSILSENHYIIISGIPGIGKTTLARMLIYNLVASGIHDLIYLSSNISEAYKSYHESTKQVFFFDDFLGSNLLENKLDRNEDKDLISFIKKIKESKNKYFIMTTREYILKQAQQKYELLNKHNINMVKCIIDLIQYTPLVRGEILYRHLYFSNMPKIYLQELVKNERYLEIIHHKNYNPRIIETILDVQEWNFISSKEYYSVFYSYFDNPESVWKHAFEQHISLIGRIIVIILGSINGLVKLEFLKSSVQDYLLSEVIGYIGDFNIDFDKALKELIGSFIKIEKDDENIDAIEYHNPSISDFIHSYFINNIDIVKLIINKCVCLDQIITIYQIFNVNISDEIKTLCENKLLDNIIQIKIIRLERSVLYKSNRPLWRPGNNSIMKKLDYISRNMFPIINDNLLIYLKEVLFQEIDKVTCDSSYETLINVYLSFHEYEYIDINYFKQFIEHITQISDSLDQLMEISRLKKVDEDIYNTIIDSELIKKKIMDLVDDEYYNVDRGGAEYTKDIMIDISENFGVNITNYIENLNEKIEDEKSEEKYIEVHKSSKINVSMNYQQDKIKEIFNTLLYK